MAVEVPGSADIFVEITNAATEINVTLKDESPVINVTVEGSGPAGRDGTDGIGVPSGGSAGQVLKKASNEDYDTEWADEGGGSSVSPYISNPAPLGTASPGSSADYARGDHVHPKPTAADVGAIAAPASPATGAFLVWNGSAWTAQTLSTWQGGNY